MDGPSINFVPIPVAGPTSMVILLDLIRDQQLWYQRKSRGFECMTRTMSGFYLRSFVSEERTANRSRRSNCEWFFCFLFFLERKPQTRRFLNTRKHFVTVWVTEHLPERHLPPWRSSKLPGHGPGQPALGRPCVSRGLHQMTSRGPLQAQPFCDAVKMMFFLTVYYANFHNIART